ncbi:hypothetical protein Tco_1506909 [Tanacetum coccineum]
MEEEKSVENNGATDKSMAEPRKSNEQEPPKEVDKTNESGRRADDEPTKGAREKVAKNKEEEQQEFLVPMRLENTARIDTEGKRIDLLGNGVPVIPTLRLEILNRFTLKGFSERCRRLLSTDGTFSIELCPF